MNQEIKILDSIIKKFKGNVFSEKSVSMSKEGVLTFRFSRVSSKYAIKDMCYQMLGVDILSVNTCNVKGKKRIFKGIAGNKSSWKKAFVKISKEDISKIAEVA
ncbi:50S ribosomal protein L23 [Candidatus Cytomitobacter indipagum]|uniref:50S ribosomal protein L23 n=1 Tax=Candidatus Cytomitobacter indipagum TaxID=2601575 RepID=A0A5C0UF24_9PROT|nr:50S ribosomal protein L23 [Candidatus Cytomitobacter indipagum]QEK38281.1 50S ribosomal protein L23 [Candidatus Cytomitobacter indipagum]